MALQTDLVSETVGFEFPQAYAKIIHINTQTKYTYIMVNWYSTLEARLEMRMPVFQKQFAIETTQITGTILPAAYAYLKTQPEFVNAIDLLDDVQQELVPTQAAAEA